MNNKTKTLIIRFKNEIRHSEIRLFRGAILNCVRESQHSAFFSGHTENGLRYSYPLIQYKRIGGNAAIICVGDGVDYIGDFFSSCNFDLKIGSRPVEHFSIDRIDAKQTLIQAWDSMFKYTLRKWLPLNSENHNEFQKIEGLAAKTEFLQSKLIGNILSMCKGLNIYLDKDIKCEILQMDEPRTVKFKNLSMKSIDTTFKTNVTLPDFCGLGKGVSLGMGMVKSVGEK